MSSGIVPVPVGSPSFINAPRVVDLNGLDADVAIIGVPYMAALFGFDADLTPRNIRQASSKYSGAYLPELDDDPDELGRVFHPALGTAVRSGRWAGRRPRGPATARAAPSP